jgi:3',5'-cyclic AMP phosphodiesterase CpdA
VPRLLHVSDLHFGAPSISEQVEALEGMIADERFDVVVVSGDISQRTRKREFHRGRLFIEFSERFSPVMIIPGNHDVAWWRAPFGVGRYDDMFIRYRLFIRRQLEPVMPLPGILLVGLNSAHGIQPWTLTTRPRDLSVVGAIRDPQWRSATDSFKAAKPGDLKVLVFHHNLLRGKISNRWGLANRARGIDHAAATGADLILCGHDHEERVEQVTRGGRRFVVASASTLTDRVRGGGPASLNVIDADDREVRVAVLEWDKERRAFEPARTTCFRR